MTKMRNFKLEENLSPYQESVAKTYSASFISDEDGNDWYELQKELDTKTWKVVISSDGTVVAFNTDASTLFPIESSVVELNKIPDELNNKGLWSYDFKLSKFTYDYIKEAENERGRLLNEVRPRIQYLSDKSDDADITESESKELLSLRAYRTEVRNLDISKAPDIKWPSLPQ